MIIYDTHLKQPKEIQLTDGRWIKHYYTGNGELNKTLYSTGEKWFYTKELTLKNDQLYQIAFPEGRINYRPLASGSWHFEYFLTDHLGNTRVTFKDSTTTDENGLKNHTLLKTAETAFDPWGLKLTGVGSVNEFQNRWELQGKEAEQTFGLNRVNFGARVYNPTTGRWDRIDPLTDHPQQVAFTPYNAFWNNPVMYTDPDGRCPSCPQGEEAAKLYAAGANVTNKDGSWNWTGSEWQEAPLLSEYKPSTADQWSEGNLAQRFAYGMADGVYSMFANSHLNGDQFASYDDKIKTKLGGFMTLAGGVFGEANAVGKGAAMVDDAAAVSTSNPFKGKTFSEIDEMFTAKNFTKKGVDPSVGKGSYINPKSGTKYYLDKGGMYKKGYEGPHVDIWYNGHPSFEKVKLFLDGSPKMYTPLK